MPSTMIDTLKLFNKFKTKLDEETSFIFSELYLSRAFCHSDYIS